jgi:hypothetical protein
MNRREFLNAAPIAIVPLVPQPEEPEELWFHSLLMQSHLLGTWLKTWGIMKLGLTVDARVGIANIIPPYTVADINCDYNNQFYQGEVVAISYKRCRFNYICENLSCGCHTMPPSDVIVAIGTTDKTIFCDKRHCNIFNKCKPCGFCNKPCKAFSHARNGHPFTNFCWACHHKMKMD